MEYLQEAAIGQRHHLGAASIPLQNPAARQPAFLFLRCYNPHLFSLASRTRLAE